MKLTRIASSIAALCAVANPAFALNASNYVPASAMNIYLSGATAQDVAVQSLLTGSLCVANTLTRYTATNQFVYICTPSSNINAGGKTQLVVHKNSIGGSGQGVVPVNNSTPLAFLNLSLINATSCPASTGTATTIACADTAAVFSSTNFSRIGISDVEPAFFGAPSAISNLKVEPLATVIFGMPVTNKAFEALQKAQGKVIGSAATADIPSLSQAQITSMFTQEAQSWSSLTGTTVGTGLGDLPDDTVYVARRVNSSGTQKTYEAVIAKTPNGDLAAKSCYANTKGFLSGPDVTDNTAANTLCDGLNGLVFNNSGSGQVQTCLARFNTVNKGAIGTLTTEQVSTASWKHVRVNGLLPNYTNVKSGAFKEYGDGTLNTRVIGTPASTALNSTTEHAAFLTALRTFFGIAAAATIHPTWGAANTDDVRAGLMTLRTVENPAGLNTFERKDPGTGDTDNCASAIQQGF